MEEIVEAATDPVEEQPIVVDEPKSPIEERLMNIIAELEGRIEQLEKDSKKLKSGLPQLGWN